MKKALFTLSILCIVLLTFGQVKKQEVKMKPAVELKTKPLPQIENVNVAKKIPVFKNVKPISLSENKLPVGTTPESVQPLPDENYIDLSRLKAIVSDVNGSLDTRQTYKSSAAFLTFDKVSINPYSSFATCNCRAPVSRPDFGPSLPQVRPRPTTPSVSVNFSGKAGKIYLITLEGSPKDSDNPFTAENDEGITLKVSANDYRFERDVDSDNQQIEFVVRPERTGMMSVKATCNGYGSWNFHKATIQEIE